MTKDERIALIEVYGWLGVLGDSQDVFETEDFITNTLEDIMEIVKDLIGEKPFIIN